MADQMAGRMMACGKTGEWLQMSWVSRCYEPADVVSRQMLLSWQKRTLAAGETVRFGSDLLYT